MLRSCTWGECDCSASTSREQFTKLDKSTLARSANPSCPHFQVVQSFLKFHHILPSYSNFKNTNSICWESLPFAVSAVGGLLPMARCTRKIVQIENMMAPCIQMIKQMVINGAKNLKIVEFCAGSGHVCLPLASMFPEHSFVLIDCKLRSLEIAMDRIKTAQLQNVTVRAQRIEHFDDPFDIGLALHACGGASDIVINKCLACKASFVVCPCCTGKMLQLSTSPRSLECQRLLMPGAYKALVQAADFGHTDTFSYSAIDRSRRLAKCYVEEDRRLLAVEHSYECHLTLMQPPDGSPKNDILIGWHTTGSALNTTNMNIDDQSSSCTSLDQYLFNLR